MFMFDKLAKDPALVAKYEGRIKKLLLKTAEVLSKILLFADDRKIKDPGILSQIKGHADNVI